MHFFGKKTKKYKTFMFDLEQKTSPTKNILVYWSINKQRAADEPKAEPALPKTVGAAASMFGAQLKPSVGETPSWKKNQPVPIEHTSRLVIISFFSFENNFLK